MSDVFSTGQEDSEPTPDFHLRPTIGIEGRPGVNLLELATPPHGLPAPQLPIENFAADAGRWAAVQTNPPRYEDDGFMRFGCGD